MADINFDPFKTQGSFAGSFNVESRGLTQGDAQDDPAIRLQLCSGTLDKNLDAPVWGGIGVVECVSTVAENVSGSTIKKKQQLRSAMLLPCSTRRTTASRLPVTRYRFIWLVVRFTTIASVQVRVFHCRSAQQSRRLPPVMIQSGLMVLSGI